MTRNTTHHIQAQKGQRPIVMLTAYTKPFAEVLDEHCDVLLVGDSLGMVLYGMDSTLPVTLAMMAQHGKAVVAASKQAMVVVDMPFGSYQQSPAQAYESAAYLMAETGAGAVKLEGGEVMAPTIAFLAERGIPVMGHVGMMPQSVHHYGGFKKQGKTDAQHQQILRDAKAVEAAGAFSLVIEATTEAAASEATQALSIPTIGIGASDHCDGQVLVSEDLAGLTDWAPGFVTRRGNMRDVLAQAAKEYAAAVKR